MPSLIDLPTPTASVAYPPCAANCAEILRANVACATANSVNDCFCSQLTWPTACENDCRQQPERTSVAAWYWDVCPSAMDSRLGQYAKTSTVQQWEVQTVGDTRWTTGYNCYYSGICAGGSSSTTVASISATPKLTSTQASSVDRKLNATIAIAVAVPVVLAVVAGITIYLLCRRQRRHRDDGRFRNLRTEMRQDQDRRAAAAREEVMLQVLLEILNNTRARPTPYTPPPRSPPPSSRRTSYVPPHRSTASPRPAPSETQFAGLERMVQNLGGAENVSTVNLDTLEEQLTEALTCPLCLEILTDPVSVIGPQTAQNQGCLHTFCRECIEEVRARDPRCPIDRMQITGVNTHRLLAEIVEAFLNRFPHHRE